MISFLNRVVRYYKRKRGLNTFKRVLEIIYRKLFKDQVILYCTDITNLSDMIIDKNFILERYSNNGLLDKKDEERLIKIIGEDTLKSKFKQRYKKNADLWLFKLNGELVGYGWTIRGATKEFYYLPLSEYDVFLFDVMIFDEFRGKGLMAKAHNHIASILKREGVTRIYGAVKLWNESSMKFAAKTTQRPFGIAKKIRLFGKEFIIYSELKKRPIKEYK